MESITQHASLAQHLRRLRVERDLTLAQLAEASGISRATLSRIENGEVSPTAESLGRLATAYSLPLSQLLAPLEPEFLPLLRHADQGVWADREKGFTRRNVSPPSGRLKLEIIECELAPHQHISYERPAFIGHEHHLVMLSGSLVLTVEQVRYELRVGDCLRYRLTGSSSFETDDQPARYLIAMA